MGNFLQIFDINVYKNYEHKFSDLNSVIVKKIFKSYNVLDVDKNIIIGVWNNPNKSNKLGNQGIWIGDPDKIYELIFGIFSHDAVILHFEKNITLIITKTKSENFLLELKEKDIINYSKIIDKSIIQKLKKINDNSLDLDLIFNIIK